MKRMVKDVGALAACLLICAGLGACGKREEAPWSGETVTEEVRTGETEAAGSHAGGPGAGGNAGGPGTGSNASGPGAGGNVSGPGAGGNAGALGADIPETLDQSEARRILEQTYQVD